MLFVVGTKLFSSKDVMRKPYCLCTKKSNKLERTYEHESSSKSVKVVANIHASLQFCGKAALERHITLSYKYRASEASEEKIHFVPFFSKKY